MTDDPMQRAREMLAATYEPDYPHIARSVREDDAADFGQWFHHAIAAIHNALLTREEDGWRPIETAPDDEPFMAGLWVTNNKTGQRWWEAYLVSIDDETGDAMYWPDGEPLPWTLQDFEAWRPLPAPPAIRSANCGGGA